MPALMSPWIAEILLTFSKHDLYNSRPTGMDVDVDVDVIVDVVVDCWLHEKLDVYRFDRVFGVSACIGGAVPGATRFSLNN